MRVRPEFRRDWRKILTRAWSARLALFWGLFGIIASLVPAAQDVLSFKTFAILTVVTQSALLFARVTKQKGFDE